MGINLKSCFFSLAALVAVAARADGAATSQAHEDPAAVSEGTAHAQYGDTHAMNEAAPCPQHAMSSNDEPSAGSASGEPRRQGTLDDWNHLEFLRNTWGTP